MIIKPSSYLSSSGGDIVKDKDDYFINPELEIELNPEDSFFATTVYKGYYVKAQEDAFDIKLFVNGGTEEQLNAYLADDYHADTLQQSKDLFTNTFYGKYSFRIPPYLPSFYELQDYKSVTDVGTDELLEQLQFNRWFENNVIRMSTSRISLFEEMEVQLLTSTEKILNIADAEIENYSLFSSAIIPDLKKEEYWGFYLRVQGNFIPDWKIYSDVAWVNLSYKTYVRNPDNSYALNEDGSRKQIQKYATPLRIILKADMTGVEGIHKIEVEKLYSNYPEYFINYLDIEE